MSTPDTDRAAGYGRPEPADDLAREQPRRLAAVRAAMAEGGYDVLVCADSGGWFQPTGAARYLTGATIGPLPGVLERMAVVVPADGPPVLVVPQGPRGGLAAQARRGVRGVLVRSDPAGGLAGGVLDDVVAAVREAGGERGRIGLSGTFTGWQQALGELLPGAEVVDTARVGGGGSGRDLLDRVRAGKSAWEVHQLVEAQRCAQVGMTAFLAAAEPGRRLTEAAAEAHVAAVRAGADDQLTIMNCGGDPWMWWHEQGDRRFLSGAVVTLETNARVSGYIAQYARATTLGDPTAAQSKLHEAARAGLVAMVDRLRIGASGDDLYRAGVAEVRRAGLEPWGRFGHGIGLAADEGIAVAPGDDIVVAEGTCLALHASVLDQGTEETVLFGEQYVVQRGRAVPLSAAIWNHPTPQEATA